MHLLFNEDKELAHLGLLCLFTTSTSQAPIPESFEKLMGYLDEQNSEMELMSAKTIINWIENHESIFPEFGKKWADKLVEMSTGTLEEQILAARGLSRITPKLLEVLNP